MDDERPRKEEENILLILQKKYFKALHTNPVLTKALTSGIMSFAANLTSQLMDRRKGVIDEIRLPPALRYGAFGFFISGPAMHYFYKYLMKAVPGKSRSAAIQRLLIERLVLTPIFTAVFHSAMAGMEYQSKEAVMLRLQAAYWVTLVMNWKYWTLLQIINVNYIPAEMKVLFGNACAFLWTIYLTSLKPKAD